MKQKAEFRARRRRAAIGMGIILTVAILFNFYPQKVSILQSATDWHTFVPILAPAFARHLPWLNLWWGASWIIRGTILWQPRPSTPRRWATTAIAFFGAGGLASIALAGPFQLPPAESVLLRYALSTTALAMIAGGVRSLRQLIHGRWLVLRLGSVGR